MKTVIGVKFKGGGKMYYFDPGEFDVKEGDGVIVETARGTEFGAVPHYRGFIHCIRHTLEHEHLGAFYKGLVPSLFKATLTTAGASARMRSCGCRPTKKPRRPPLM